MIDAVRNGDTKNLELLLEQGSDPNLTIDRWGTALMHASDKGISDICELLLYWGADPNLKNQYGETALANAAQSGHTDIVRLLLDWGADPNIQGPGGAASALIRDSQSGHTDIVRLLLDRGADINYRISNADALMYASTWGNTDIVRLLLDRGANPNFVDERGKTALMRATDNNHTAIVRLLLDNGANPNFVDRWGDTALTRATDNGNTAIVTLLMRYMTTIRMQSLQRGKMTRRKLRTSMARKRSSTSQLGDRYALGEDIIHRLNSHMTRPNLTDMIDEIPRNMTRTNRRDSYEIEDDFFNNSDSDDYGKAFKHGSEPEPEQVFEPEPEPEPEQVFEPVTDREIIDDVNHEYNKGLEIDLKRHRLENELKEKKQRESDSRHEMARSQRRERLRSVLESAKEPLNNHDMEEIRRRRLARFSKLTGAGRNRRNKTRNKYMY